MRHTMQPTHQSLKTAFLVAFDSPKQAFYVLWIEAGGESFRVCKVSGAKGRIWHRQAWEFDSLAAAEALFEKRLREKTRPDRRSIRKYELQCVLPIT
jgi:hypothetical protein